MTLFDLPPVAEDRKSGKPSYTQRLTIRRNADLARGVHPVTRLALAGGDHTCGECDHAIVNRCARNYYKCDLNVSRGPVTDIRLSWPACTAWKPADA